MGTEDGPRGTEDNGGDQRRQETQAGARGTPGDMAALLITRPRPAPVPPPPSSPPSTQSG